MAAAAKQDQTYKTVQVTAPKKLELVERKLPELKKGEVLVRVEACGVCHSDSLPIFGHWPNLKFPIVPGHEVVGTVVAVDADAKRWKIGSRVGRGWHGNHCFECHGCLSGDFYACSKSGTTGISFDGGYGEYMVAPWEALAAVPANLSSADAAPLLCAGLTVFNSMRNMKVMPGSLVAIQGIGGLGHYAVQFARKMGFRVAAISTSDDKRQLATELGAHDYIDTSKVKAAEALQKLGGAKMIVATAFDSKAVAGLVDGLGQDGILLVLGAAHDAMAISSIGLISQRRVVQGWPSGVPQDAEDTMAFAALQGIKSYVETFPLEKAQEAFDRMMSNKARFRVVITTAATADADKAAAAAKAAAKV